MSIAGPPFAAGLRPSELFAAALAGGDCVVHGLSESPVALPMPRWTGHADDSDQRLLRRCTGPTLDVGCGPGRMTHALTVRGTPTLGIDVLPQAVALTRARGSTAMVRDVFAAVPGEGRWQHALLADGNIGIGGDAVRLLRRVRSLLRVGGVAVADLARPGTPPGPHVLRLEHSGRSSEPFWWTVVTPGVLGSLAEAAALRVLEVEEHQGRWFAELQRCPGGHT